MRKQRRHSLPACPGASKRPTHPTVTWRLGEDDRRGGPDYGRGSSEVVVMSMPSTAKHAMRRPTRYLDRADAGKRLAEYLRTYAGRPDVRVLGLPRGGVATAAAVAAALSVRLDVFVVRKVGVPWHPELAMGAVASGGVRVLNRDVIDRLGITSVEIEDTVAAERSELERREQLYRGDHPPPDLTGKVVILVDDGLATGATARAAVAAARLLNPAKVVLAVPVAPRDAIEQLTHGTAEGGAPDDVVCPLAPTSFDAVGHWYDDFTPTTDAEVRSLLGDKSAMSD